MERLGARIYVNFTFAISGVWSALHQLDRFFQRVHLDDREARNEFLRLGERTIDDGALVAAELHARTLRSRGEPLGGEEDDSFVAMAMTMKRIALS
jgi:hypothetical protein